MPTAARPSARGSRHERSCPRAPPMPAARRSWTRRNAVVVLPAVPVTPIVGTRARSSTRSPRQRTRAPAARSRETRGATSGVQTSRNASSCSPGSRSRSACSRTSTSRARSASASAVAGPEPASVTERPSVASSRASATASAIESLDEGRHPREGRDGRGGAAVPPRPASADRARAPSGRSTVAGDTGLSASAGTRGPPCSWTGPASATSRPSHACRSGSTRARRRASRRRAKPSTRRTSSRRRAPGSAR